MRHLAWDLGVFLDWVHIPGAILLLPFGSLWMPSRIHVHFTAAIASLQTLFLGCPLVVLSTWLRQQYDPYYYRPSSLTFVLYHHFGRSFGVVALAFLLALASIVNRAVRGSQMATISDGEVPVAALTRQLLGWPSSINRLFTIDGDMFSVCPRIVRPLKHHVREARADLRRKGKWLRNTWDHQPFAPFRIRIYTIGNAMKGAFPCLMEMK
jgi:hypothetical protein